MSNLTHLQHLLHCYGKGTALTSVVVSPEVMEVILIVFPMVKGRPVGVVKVRYELTAGSEAVFPTRKTNVTLVTPPAMI